MQPLNTRQSDDLLEILKAYKFPTFIMSIGLVAATLLFYVSLQYDLRTSAQDFRLASEETVDAMQQTIEQRQQLVSSMAVTFENIQNLSQQEFRDITLSFIEATRFVDFRLFKYEAADGLIKLSKDEVSIEGGSITSYFTSAPDTEDKLGEMASLPLIRDTIERVHTTGQARLSRAFMHDELGSIAVIVAPVKLKSGRKMFLVGTFDLSTFFRERFTRAEVSDARVYDVYEGDSHLIFEDISEENEDFLALTLQKESNALSFQHRVFFEDHFWKIVIFSPFSNSAQTISLFPWVIFILALALTAMVSLMVFRITTETLNTRRIVEQQTLSLKNYARRLEISNRDLEDFAHVASHDLKEPLRGMYNYAEFLIEDYSDKLDEDGKNKLETLRKLAQRMESFIESLLEYSMLTNEEFRIQKTDLNDIATNVLKMQQIWLEEHNAEVVIKGELPTVYCDPVRTAEVYRNLITNGVKYNDSEQKVVELGYTTSFEQWKDIPILFVKDNGIGIDEKNKNQVFKMFKRLHGREAYGGGTGAGLTLVWKIIKRHKGDIWLESEPDKGTTFFFTLKEKPNAGQ
ncbi:MAG: hypothetical protein JKY71_09300 [Alphaproteobacteria bacterium]|nr:hypothetical protein [Alphaproteobacteria bacterium]